MAVIEMEILRWMYSVTRLDSIGTEYTKERLQK